MTLMSRVAHTGEYTVITTDTNAVAVYTANTLKRIYTERFGDVRVVGIMAEGARTLHVLDANGMYFNYDLSAQKVKDSFAIRLNAGKAAKNATMVSEAHFHYAPMDTKDGWFRAGDLCVAVMTPEGLRHAKIDSQASDSVLVVPLPPGLKRAVASVGLRSGTLIVGQPNQRWLWYVNPFRAGISPASGGSRAPPMQMSLTIAMKSVACHPTDESIAVGGARGELVYFPNLSGSTSHFADHWHHTPLEALAFSTDGFTLFSGAGESVVLLWNLSDLSFRKLGCSLGRIEAITPSTTEGHRLLISCNQSVLANVDLRLHKVLRSVEGIHWSAGHPCRGVTMLRWMGQPCVALTGLPNVVRICDPYSQQSVHSLHIGHQLETVADPPAVGVRHIAVLNGGRTVVTYETFETYALPPTLRFWRYDEATRKHVEAQHIERPHESEVIALVADENNQRVFTVSSQTVKCWKVATVAAGTSTALDTPDQWRNVATSAAPSNRVSDLALSPDGSVLFVADDSVHAYDVDSLEIGVAWDNLATFTQDFHTKSLRGLRYFAETNRVVAFGGNLVFSWDAENPTVAPTSFYDAAPVAAIDRFGEDTLLVINVSGEYSKVRATTMKLEARAVGPAQVQHAAVVKANAPHVAVILPETGFSVINVEFADTSAGSPKKGKKPAAAAAGSIETVEFTGGAAAPSPAAAAALGSYFKQRDGGAANVDEDGVEAAQQRAANVTHTRRWLHDVLGSQSYAAPPVGSLLPAFLGVLNGDRPT